MNPETEFYSSIVAVGLACNPPTALAQEFVHFNAAVGIGRAEQKGGMVALALLASDKPEHKKLLEDARIDAKRILWKADDQYSFETRGAHAGMARSLHVSAWADSQEEAQVKFPAGADIDKLAPETTPESKYAAAKLIGRYEEINHNSFDNIQNEAAKADGVKTPFKPFEFGWNLGMMALGSGVGWFDDHEKFPLKTPHIEFHLDGPDTALGPKPLDQEIAIAEAAASRTVKSPTPGI